VSAARSRAGNTGGRRHAAVVVVFLSIAPYHTARTIDGRYDGWSCTARQEKRWTSGGYQDHQGRYGLERAVHALASVCCPMLDFCESQCGVGGVGRQRWRWRWGLGQTTKARNVSYCSWQHDGRWWAKGGQTAPSQTRLVGNGSAPKYGQRRSRPVQSGVCRAKYKVCVCVCVCILARVCVSFNK